jgi:peptidoglycan hydrolase-like protein with peptidoglycan-binding domain
MKRALIVALSALMFFGPLIFLGWLRFRLDDTLSAIEVEAQPIEVIVSSISDDGSRDAVLSIALEDPPSIAAPNWSGLVTELGVKAGDSIREGDILVAVDGIDRIAVATVDPPYRTLVSRTRGADVAEAQAALKRLGFYTGDVDGSYGSEMATAARSLAVELGVDRPDGSLDASWFVWLPSQHFEVSKVSAELGFPAPASGEPWIEGARPVTGARLLGQDGTPLDLSGRWVFTIDSLTVPIIDGQAVATASELRKLVADAGALPSGDTDQSSDLQIVGLIQLESPLSVIEIPATALVTSESGQLCVYRKDGTGYSPTPVDVNPGRPGLVTVATGLSSGETILANPADLFGSPSCR